MRESHDTRQREDRRIPWARLFRYQTDHMRHGPHVAEVERRIAQLAEHYQRLGGWRALEHMTVNRPTGGTQ